MQKGEQFEHMMNMIRSTETTFNAHILIVFALSNLHNRSEKKHIHAVYNGMTQVIVVLLSLSPMSEWSLKSAADASQIH